MVLACASAFAAEGGKVGSSVRSVNEVAGRASASPAVVGGHAVNTKDNPAVSEVYGRGNQLSRASAATIGVGALEVGDFGRESSNLAKAHTKPGVSDTTVASVR
jgi:hypothetical protein